MISRIAVILFLIVSATAIVSAQSPPKQLTKESATIQLNPFEGKRSDLLKDEVPLYYLRSDFPSHESRGDFPAKGFVEVIVPLSKADFDRAIGLADRIRQPELKLHMKILAIQAATSE